MFSFLCAWINCWVNNREVGDLRRHHAHYDVTVMPFRNFIGCNVVCWKTISSFISPFILHVVSYSQTTVVKWSHAVISLQQCAIDYRLVKLIHVQEERDSAIIWKTSKTLSEVTWTNRVRSIVLTPGIWEIIFSNHFPSYKSCLGSFKPLLIEYYASLNADRYIRGWGWCVFWK